MRRDSRPAPAPAGRPAGRTPGTRTSSAATTAATPTRVLPFDGGTRRNAWLRAAFFLLRFHVVSFCGGCRPVRGEPFVRVSEEYDPGRREADAPGARLRRKGGRAPGAPLPLATMTTRRRGRRRRAAADHPPAAARRRGRPRRPRPDLCLALSRPEADRPGAAAAAGPRRQHGHDDPPARELHPPRQCRRAAPGGPAPLLRLCGADHAQRHHRQRPRAPGRAARRRRRPRDAGRRRRARGRRHPRQRGADPGQRGAARARGDRPRARRAGGHALLRRLQRGRDRRAAGHHRPHRAAALGQGPGLALRRAQRQPAAAARRAEARPRSSRAAAGRTAGLRFTCSPERSSQLESNQPGPTGPGRLAGVFSIGSSDSGSARAICMGRLLWRRPPVSRSGPCRAIPPTVALAPPRGAPFNGGASSPPARE